jgi:type II secretory pathway pseudopilin PulG
MKRTSRGEGGFTIVELVLTTVVFAIVALSMLTLFTSLVHSAVVAKREAVALSLANNQMEYLKSLPYNSLAVAGGNIVISNPLPATTTQTVNGTKYTITTSISYVDDYFDGCATYPAGQEQTYCRNCPAPCTSPPLDTNPADYKIADVRVTDPSGAQLAELDTEISARVAETASTTGMLVVSIIDSTGSPISGATAHVTNGTVTPGIDQSQQTDQNGIAIFYGLTPDSGTDYVITASKTGYSTLTTIKASGSLQPTYPSQKILTQASSYVTLTIKQQGSPSLLLETTDTSGNPISGAKIYIKGGYKKYTSTSDTSYYYDNMNGSDTRPTTDASGLAGVSSLVPGSYVFCGDAGATGCSVSGTAYYLAAAVPYSGSNPFNPIAVPTYDPSNPPGTTYAYGGSNYLQKVRLILTPSSSFPRINTLSPSETSLAGNASSFSFTITGTNLPCNALASNCSTSVKFTQGSNTYTASCTGASTGLQLSCTVNMSTASVGTTQMIVSANGFTFTLPASPLLGGINVAP